MRLHAGRARGRRRDRAARRGGPGHHGLGLGGLEHEGLGRVGDEEGRVVGLLAHDVDRRLVWFVTELPGVQSAR